MIKGRDLVIFAGDWGWFPSVMERIAEHLLRDNRIIWVGSLSMRRPKLRPYDIRRITGRLTALVTGKGATSRTESRPNVIQPFILPFYDIPVVKRFNDALLIRLMRNKMKAQGFRESILLTATPMVVDVIDSLGVRSSHYFCLDDYGEYDGAYKAIPALEQRILTKVDSCFALSEPLMKSRRASPGENHYIPMGVDTELFRPDPDNVVPPELSGIPHPIAGFFGQIGSYVDIDLVVQCARAYPKTTFVVIGRAHIDVSILGREPNILFVGEVAYEDVPRFARCFDVGLNPRVINKLSMAMNPLKILEYLSFGMPVVSTDLPAVRTFEKVVHIASTREHFIQLIGVAIAESDPDLRAERRNIAGQFSWSIIASRISETIERIDAAS